MPYSMKIGLCTDRLPLLVLVSRLGASAAYFDGQVYEQAVDCANIHFLTSRPLPGPP